MRRTKDRPTRSRTRFTSLIIRDVTGAFEPALATDWAPTDDPNVWRFNLRQGVTFHDGAAMTAEDVVFSFERAKTEDSDMKELLNSIVEVRAVDDHTIDMVTDGPNPILPNNLTNLFIMDKDWTEANNAVKVQVRGRRRHFLGPERQHRPLQADQSRTRHSHGS